MVKDHRGVIVERKVREEKQGPTYRDVDANHLFLEMARPPSMESQADTDTLASTTGSLVRHKYNPPVAASPREKKIGGDLRLTFSAPTHSARKVEKSGGASRVKIPTLFAGVGPSIKNQDIDAHRGTSNHTFFDIWSTLRSIDCNHLYRDAEHSFHWCDVLDLLMSYFPDTSWDRLADIHHADGSMEVGCIVSVNGITRSATLQVENESGELLIGPNAQQVSDARMRCWVRCISLFGLGLDAQRQSMN